MPRSPGRDLADRLAGNRRYFRHWNPLEKWKLWLGGGALLLAVGWAAATFLTNKFDYQTTHGELASVHSAWNDKCDACHATPESSGVLDAQARWRTFTCQKCHAAPPHHASVKPDDIVNNDCSSCHYDHRGKNHSLVKLSDDKCVRCHRDLAANVNGSTQYGNVTSFASNHPMEIRSAQNHQRHLKFSHSQHLTPGMVLSEGAKNAWKFSDIPFQYINLRANYEKQQGQDFLKDGIVHLDCKSCHTLETDQGAHAGGRYYQPVNFNKHCIACHQLKIPPVVTNQNTVTSAFDVPHGVPLIELRKQVINEVSLQLQQSNPALFQGQTIKDLLISKEPIAVAFQQELIDVASKSFLSLQKTTLAKCHEFTDDSFNWNADLHKQGIVGKLAVEPLKIVPTAIPNIWMKHAKFDHTAHRAMKCLDCHPNAVSKIENGKTIVNENEPVNLPNLHSCRECHSQAGGVRHGCTDCHSFHNNDHPLQGRGAPAFVPNRPMTIEEFLKGK